MKSLDSNKKNIHVLFVSLFGHDESTVISGDNIPWLAMLPKTDKKQRQRFN